MTILTLDEKINVSKTHFSDLTELYYFLIEKDIIPTLKELDEKDYSQDLIDGANECLMNNSDNFVNI